MFSTILTNDIYLIRLYKEDLALNIQQWLIFNKTQPNPTHSIANTTNKLNSHIYQQITVISIAIAIILIIATIAVITNITIYNHYNYYCHSNHYNHYNRCNHSSYYNHYDYFNHYNTYCHYNHNKHHANYPLESKAHHYFHKHNIYFYCLKLHKSFRILTREESSKLINLATLVKPTISILIDSDLKRIETIFRDIKTGLKV